MNRQVEFRVISIGTLAAHPLWDERSEVRTGHATTTLVSGDSARVLVDPSLPAPALLARMGERTRTRAAQVTHVFLTSADRLHRRAIAAFPGAAWLVHEPELEAARAAVERELAAAAEGGDETLADFLEEDRRVLQECRPAPDRIVEGVDLFPLPGASPGCCGLLLPLPRATVCICGDAVPTIEHLQQGKVLPDCYDLEQARESLAEVVQIADVLILGRDNIALNPLRAPMGL